MYMYTHTHILYLSTHKNTKENQTKIIVVAVNMLSSSPFLRSFLRLTLRPHPHAMPPQAQLTFVAGSGGKGAQKAAKSNESPNFSSPRNPHVKVNSFIPFM